MRKLVLSPDEKSYSARPGQGSLSAMLDGGASHFRPDHADPALRVSLGWETDANEYRYLRAFYRTGTATGSEPFLIDLLGPDGLPQEHLARFVVGSMELSGVTGSTYIVRAEVEARSRPQP